jgi:uncharacterized membrane protein YphA (DoxX/SURF4 family)
MNALLRFGRVLFAIGMVFFGAQFVIFAASLTGPVPGPPWTRGSVIVAWLVATGFIAAGLSIVSGMMARWVSLLLGAALLGYGLIQYGPALVAKPHDPGPWTVLFELLALGGGAWVIAASFPPPPQGRWVYRLAHAGRILIAISLVVFAVQHFIYAGFVATLVPAWIPARLFWAYFAGVAFLAAALSFVARKMVRLAAFLLGTMFLLWVLVLHIPRVAGAVRNGNEVTSLFVCLAMSGVGYALVRET